MVQSSLSASYVDSSPDPLETSFPSLFDESLLEPLSVDPRLVASDEVLCSATSPCAGNATGTETGSPLSPESFDTGRRSNAYPSTEAAESCNLSWVPYTPDVRKKQAASSSRQKHNERERSRRQKFTQCITQLREVVPGCKAVRGNKEPDKAAVLSRAVEYIIQLQRENAYLRSQIFIPQSINAEDKSPQTDFEYLSDDLPRKRMKLEVEDHSFPLQQPSYNLFSSTQIRIFSIFMLLLVWNGLSSVPQLLGPPSPASRTLLSTTEQIFELFYAVILHTGRWLLELPWYLLPFICTLWALFELWLVTSEYFSVGPANAEVAKLECIAGVKCFHAGEYAKAERHFRLSMCVLGHCPGYNNLLGVVGSLAFHTGRQLGHVLYIGLWMERLVAHFIPRAKETLYLLSTCRYYLFVNTALSRPIDQSSWKMLVYMLSAVCDAEVLGDSALLGQMYIVLGCRLDSANSNTTCRWLGERYTQSAYQIASRLNGEHLLGYVYFMIGYNRFCSGRLNEAEQILQKAENLLRKSLDQYETEEINSDPSLTGLERWYIDCRMLICTLQVLQGDFTLARLSIRSLLRMFQSEQHQRSRSFSFLRLLKVGILVHKSLQQGFRDPKFDTETTRKLLQQIQEEEEFEVIDGFVKSTILAFVALFYEDYDTCLKLAEKTLNSIDSKSYFGFYTAASLGLAIYWLSEIFLTLWEKKVSFTSADRLAEVHVTTSQFEACKPEQLRLYCRQCLSLLMQVQSLQLFNPLITMVRARYAFNTGRVSRAMDLFETASCVAQNYGLFPVATTAERRLQAWRSEGRSVEGASRIV